MPVSLVRRCWNAVFCNSIEFMLLKGTVHREDAPRDQSGCWQSPEESRGWKDLGFCHSDRRSPPGAPLTFSLLCPAFLWEELTWHMGITQGNKTHCSSAPAHQGGVSRGESRELSQAKRKTSQVEVELMSQVEVEMRSCPCAL